jgi:hypothetical protein
MYLPSDVEPGGGALTEKAGTAVIFAHAIVHTSWLETDTDRRVARGTYGPGSEEWSRRRPATTRKRGASTCRETGFAEAAAQGSQPKLRGGTARRWQQSPTLLGAIPSRSARL